MAIEERTTTAGVGRRDPAQVDSQRRAGTLDVSSRLFAEGYRFDFFQSVWLLEQALQESGRERAEASAGIDERIRIRPHSGLTFPSSDIHKIEWLDQEAGRVQLTVTFMGLYGVASPLPVYFYDAIGTSQEGAEPLRDFLDIFNRRLYRFLYQAWKKYRQGLQRFADDRDGNERIFLSLAGMGTTGFERSRHISPLRLAALAGFLSNGVRNALGLQTMVSTLFEGLAVRIEENMPRWVVVRDRPRMGGSKGAMTLGSSALLGGRVRDASGKFRVVIGPLGLQRFRSFLPEGEAAEILDYVIRLYATDHLDYDVSLLLKTSEVPPIQLGGSQMLGVDAWLGRPEGDVISVVIRYP